MCEAPYLSVAPLQSSWPVSTYHESPQGQHRVLRKAHHRPRQRRNPGLLGSDVHSSYQVSRNLWLGKEPRPHLFMLYLIVSWFHRRQTIYPELTFAP